MPPGKSKVLRKPMFGKDVKDKRGISRINLSKREILKLRAQQKKK